MPKPDPATGRGRPGPKPRPRPAAAAAQGTPRSATAKTDKLPVSEFLYDRAGAASPFGDDVTFPLPTGHLSYRHE